MNPLGTADRAGERRRALLAALLGEEGVGPAALAPIPRRPAGEEAPLSFAQERLWFLDRLLPGSPVYNVPTLVPLQGAIRADLLARALNEVVRRHEILRTTFAVRQGRPLQRVAPSLDIELSVADRSGWPAADRQAEVERLASAEARRPFDLERGPLLRALLVRMAEQQHLLVLVLHHIVCDAWSLDVLLRELTLLYNAYAAGRPAELPELPIQYGDFTVWQRRHLQGATLERLLDFWRRQLAGAPAILELPLDRPRPPMQTFHGAMLSFSIPPEVERALRDLSRSEQATLFMSMLAAFAILLQRHSGQETLVVGTPISGRTRSELEGLIGFFLNTLALPVNVSGESSLRELVRRVRETTLQAYAHQDLPFERLVEELQPERRLNVSPLFQALFVLQVAPGSETEELEGDRPLLATGTSKFDLTLSVFDSGRGLGGLLEYNTDLFDGTTAARMSDHLMTLLGSALADPDRPVSQARILTEPERQQLLEWNDTDEAREPLERLPHELFAAQAAATPGLEAVVLAGEHLTYGELLGRSARLARRLARLGVGPEVAVGLCVERSFELVIGLLAILEAGGIYVPLDPSYPEERLAYMVADSGAAVVLTQRDVRRRFAGLGEGWLCLDAEEEWPAPRPDGSVLRASPENLAYLVYTSGSTGRPKGVAVSFRTLVNVLAWQHGLTPAGRTLQFTSSSFDVSLVEILGPLTQGGTVVLLPEETKGDLPAIARLLAREKVETAFFPFTALQHLAEYLARAAEPPQSLCRVVSTGEALHVTGEVTALFRRLPGATLWNGYGPSETQFVTDWRLPPGDPAGWPPLPPIGRPILRSRVYVLDRRMQPVPAGVIGEIYAGGVTPARGYLGRPELTAERFLPDPFAGLHGEPGARLYKTGDLARTLPDGRIEFLGRIDHQVKIRGFRVELGEVEVALGEHPGVREAVVVARGDRSAGQHLVAYLVAQEGPAPPASELRRFLLERLPQPMVPAVFVPLERLPVGPTGKIDRLALPEPESMRPETEYLPPRSPFEAELAEVWMEVLSVERVGVRDDFFALGGHSLLATQLLTRVREIFGVELSLRRVFESPTVEGMALAVVEAQVEETEAEDFETLLAEIEALSPEQAKAQMSHPW